MPCLEEKDLSDIAELHIKAQNSIIANLKGRVTGLESERSQLVAAGATPETSDRLKQVNGAIKHLRLELYGEVETAPGSMQFKRDPDKKPAEERFEVMTQLYRDRKAYQFIDSTKDFEDPRKASIFGLPTIKEMVDRGQLDIAEEMMVRSTSLLQAKNDSRNPVDYLDTDGLEVKLALANSIEHHHIYNNVKVGEDGRVQFKSFRISMGKGGELEMSVIPSYWNAQENGRNTQFIALMDGMHAGDDPITHLHYYRFTDDEAAPIKDKIRADVAVKAAEAQKTSDRLQVKLSELEQRRADPKAFERSLETQLSNAETELERIRVANEPFKGKRNLTDDQRAQKDDLAAQKKVWDQEARRVQRKLDEHREIATLRDTIDANENLVASLSAQASAISLRGKLTDQEKADRKAEKNRLNEEIRETKIKIRDQKKLLKEKGDIDELIERTQKSLREAQLIADLDEDKAIALFDKQNGFFSFDKGTEEKNDHATYRPIMNEEITRFYVRETVNYLQDKYGDRWEEELRAITERQYRSNLLQRLGALQDKLDPSRKAAKAFHDGGWGGDD